MKSKNYAMVVVIALAFFAISSISSHNQHVVVGIPKAFSLQTGQTLGVNVTVLGTIKASTVAPACSLSNPPCTIPETSIYYVVVNGRNYRLVFSNTTELPNVMGSMSSSLDCTLHHQRFKPLSGHLCYSSTATYTFRRLYTSSDCLTEHGALQLSWLRHN